ncbi:hypothetical protein [Mycoplana sp. MJR14]|uniref:hypothetical protein n=1 Tax=Mycoplana sp. MJR14 TaxID=3032583 RepID=UPI0023DAD615|nr:hypothetical protein [Mycoplana sp. MJR14]MDF1634756.1 hypothetical protein [Mycoplana sp. MJR14]
MSKLQKIEESVASLDSDDFAAFSRWFERLQAKRWDEAFDRDARTSGKLSELADEALSEHRAGRTKAL